MELSEVHITQVVGAGQMGQGIAQVLAQAEFQVSLCDQELAIAERARAQIEHRLNKQVEKERLSPAQAHAVLSRIEASDVASAASRADLAIEAVSERFDLKQSLFRELDAQLKPSAPLFSNTSSISITKLAAVTSRPAQVLGLHFMNPVPVMQLVEIVKGLETSTTTLNLARALSERLGKTHVTSEDRPGFIVNRILIPLLNEACFALQEGVASVEDIDTAIRLGLNHPMGPFGLADLIGLDTVLAIAEVLHTELGDDKYRPASLLRNLVAAGRLGRKAKKGFYDYSTDPPSAAR